MSQKQCTDKELISTDNINFPSPTISSNRSSRSKPSILSINQDLQIYQKESPKTPPPLTTYHNSSSMVCSSCIQNMQNPSVPQIHICPTWKTAGSQLTSRTKNQSSNSSKYNTNKKRLIPKDLIENPDDSDFIDIVNTNSFQGSSNNTQTNSQIELSKTSSIQNQMGKIQQKSSFFNSSQQQQNVIDNSNKNGENENSQTTKKESTSNDRFSIPILNNDQSSQSKGQYDENIDYFHFQKESKTSKNSKTSHFKEFYYIEREDNVNFNEDCSSDEFADIPPDTILKNEGNDENKKNINQINNFTNKNSEYSLNHKNQSLQRQETGQTENQGFKEQLEQIEQITLTNKNQENQQNKEKNILQQQKNKDELQINSQKIQNQENNNKEKEIENQNSSSKDTYLTYFSEIKEESLKSMQSNNNKFDNFFEEIPDNNMVDFKNDKVVQLQQKRKKVQKRQKQEVLTKRQSTPNLRRLSKQSIQHSNRSLPLLESQEIIIECSKEEEEIKTQNNKSSEPVLKDVSWKLKNQNFMKNQENLSEDQSQNTKEYFQVKNKENKLLSNYNSEINNIHQSKQFNSEQNKLEQIWQNNKNQAPLNQISNYTLDQQLHIQNKQQQQLNSNNNSNINKLISDENVISNSTPQSSYQNPILSHQQYNSNTLLQKGGGNNKRDSNSMNVSTNFSQQQVILSGNNNMNNQVAAYDLSNLSIDFSYNQMQQYQQNQQFHSKFGSLQSVDQLQQQSQQIQNNQKQILKNTLNYQQKDNSIIDDYRQSTFEEVEKGKDSNDYFQQQQNKTKSSGEKDINEKQDNTIDQININVNNFNDNNLKVFSNFSQDKIDLNQTNQQFSVNNSNINNNSQSQNSNNVNSSLQVHAKSQETQNQLKIYNKQIITQFLKQHKQKLITISAIFF